MIPAEFEHQTAGASGSNEVIDTPRDFTTGAPLPRRPRVNSAPFPWWDIPYVPLYDPTRAEIYNDPVTGARLYRERMTYTPPAEVQAEVPNNIPRNHEHLAPWPPSFHGWDRPQAMGQNIPQPMLHPEGRFPPIYPSLQPAYAENQSFLPSPTTTHLLSPTLTPHSPFALALHPCLEAAANTFRRIIWDVVYPPSGVYAANNISNISPSEPATHPSVKTLKITIPYMRPDWPDLIVNGKPSVTIDDVLNGIYTYLQNHITMDDMHSILRQSNGGRTMKDIEFACYTRCKRNISRFHEERMKGIKRVDVLMGFTTFDGLYYEFDGTLHLRFKRTTIN